MPIEIKDVVAIGGVLVSLVIGVRNWIVTTSIRSGTIKLEEFRSQIRDPIQKKLDKLGEVREALGALQRPNGLLDEDLKSKIAAQVAVLEFAAQDLDDLFDHADKSSFAAGSNWRLRYGVKLDEQVDKLGRLTVEGALDRMAAGGTLSDTVRVISEVAGELRLRFEHEVKGFVPAGLFGRVETQAR